MNDLKTKKEKGLFHDLEIRLYSDYEKQVPLPEIDNIIFRARYYEKMCRTVISIKTKRKFKRDKPWLKSLLNAFDSLNEQLDETWAPWLLIKINEDFYEFNISKKFMRKLTKRNFQISIISNLN